MRPLDGVRVLDLTRVLAGPFCTRLLAEAGAEVIKVEFEEGDMYRLVDPKPLGMSVLFATMNPGKKSITLNLKKKEGLEVLYKLMKRSDVLIENFKPGVMKRLGADYEAVKALNPRLIYCSISGFGQDGPYHDSPGFDLMAQGSGGLMAITGGKDGEPVRVGTPITDFGTGQYAAYAILLAFIAREKTGKGQYIDCSLFNTALSWTAMMALAAEHGRVLRRMGTETVFGPADQVFKTKDGFVAVTAVNEKQFRAFCRAIGREDLANDHKFQTHLGRMENRLYLTEIFVNAIASMTTKDFMARLRESDVPHSHVLDKIEDLLHDPHVIHQKMLVEIEHPILGGRVKVAGIPYRLSETPSEISSPPPLLGQHTGEVLRELGYSDAEIEELKKQGCI